MAVFVCSVLDISVPAELIITREGHSRVGDGRGAILLVDVAFHRAVARNPHPIAIGIGRLALIVNGGHVEAIAVHVVGQVVDFKIVLGGAANEFVIPIDIVHLETAHLGSIPIEGIPVAFKHVFIVGPKVVRCIKVGSKAPKLTFHTAGATVVALVHTPVVDRVVINA